MSEVYETIKRGLEDAVNGRVTEHMVEYAPVVHGEWIPVTERLPKIGEKVLVSTKYTVFTQVFKRIYGTPDRWGWEHSTIKKVSAWMPLPEPWKGELNEID